ncbi:MAG: bifunctional aspartate kinase/homoserine dehydrogenase I [Bacteroidetes bacterium]|nr:bifunctional aspartate kinase/homoserine dehydrogenase I [Bacteroidota bacterium]MDA1120071.1 bifunctional aspartate kinase/homoserine dehydrogenase I [Bacteroidota bacterium]
MKVLKFGGTSVGSQQNIRQVAEIIKNYHQAGEKVAVVVSAMSGVTNRLIKIGERSSKADEEWKSEIINLRKSHLETAKKLIGTESKAVTQIVKSFNELEAILTGVYLLQELSPRTLDLIQSFGERLASVIIAEFLTSSGLKSESIDARSLIRTDDHFGNANVDFKVTNKNINEFFRTNKGIPVITGFIASSELNQTTTLGRGGSDYTAAIIAAAIDANEIEIWTDVDGVLTADPRKVKAAYSLPSLTFNEALEMSHFGAKVIYPPTLQPAIAKRITMKIRNTFNPDFIGTLITEQPEKSNFLVKGISSIDEVSLISVSGSGMIGVPGVASRLFGSLADKNINVILITQASSEHSITFAVKPDMAKISGKTIRSEFEIEINRGQIDDVKIENNLSVLAVIGENMRNTPGIAAKMFTSLGRNGINVVAIAQGSSELNLSIVISFSNLTKALNVLHEAFFLSNQKQLNLFLAGIGLIGSTLLEQIKAKSKDLFKEQHLKINLIGITNSRHKHFNEEGMELSGWKEKIDYPGRRASTGSFIAEMTKMNLPNSVFIDCTSSEEVVSFYQQILESSISIVTPNKLANSSTHISYKKLKKTAFDHGVKFLYETNVGAGLPIISTMNDLKNSGDEFQRIEGILSGTISYIFNNFNGSSSFSSIVKEAQKNGLTEPDPRDDLNGMDVARKILILSREAGQPLELSDISIEPILPEACFNASSVDNFFKELELVDDLLEKLRQEAESQGMVLRYIASTSGGSASIKLEKIGPDHPFYNLSGSDNIISFTTRRYNERPLVVKGPGAGAEVTAAGVFAEIISISNYLSPENMKLNNG